MTLEEALEFADEWSKDSMFHAISEGSCAAFVLLADEVRRQSAENKTLRALAKCDCGDEFTADDPGMCVNCAVTR